MLTEIDRSLLQRCIAHETGAWQDFVDRFIGLFLHVIKHCAHSKSTELQSHDYDDFCSDIFLTILANNYAVLRNFRGESSLATYLTIIARRVVAKEISHRRMAEAFGHVRSNNGFTGSVSNHDNPRIDSNDLVQRMLSGLNTTDAEIVKMYHLEGLSYREISHHLGIPENTIGPTLSRARELMRRMSSP